MTTPDENKAIVRSVIEDFINKGDESVVDRYYDPSWQQLRPGMAALMKAMAPPGGAVGRPQAPASAVEAQKGGRQHLARSFSNMRYEIKQLIAENDWVAARWTFHGTHTGDFIGVPATGKELEFDQVGLWHMQDGKLVGGWFLTDELGQMLQLGWKLVPGDQAGGQQAG